jgi:hypothetical protein
MPTAIHITHESTRKIGGIGSVLTGICNAEVYKNFYDTTCFYGPLFDRPADSFLHFGPAGTLLYSSRDRYDAANYTDKLTPIAEKYNIEIVYGTRKLTGEFDINKHTDVQIINVGINTIDHNELVKFKYNLWENFGIESDQYRDNWDYEQYLRIAVPYLEIVEALFGRDKEYYHFAHEYMGIASALSVLLNGKNHTTIFVGHEVTTARSVVEDCFGHDISFYNILKKTTPRKSLEQIYGSQQHNPRSELVKLAQNFDHIFAVGDHVKDEYLFLCPQTDPGKITIAYNGVSAGFITLQQKQKSRQHLINYTRELLNFTPDIILTHVTRMVLSKGIWRDIELLGSLDDIFAANGLKGVYILLSTVIANGRSPADILKMEEQYGWPILHKEGWPDLIGVEIDTYRQLQIFNAKSRAIKGVFLNQFGFNRTQCGKRIPAEVRFDDLRIASDAEFGLSIYEPFGIAQIETIPFGGLAILSSSCGCVGLLRDKFAGAEIQPFYIVDYISTGKKMNFQALKNLSIGHRTQLEQTTAKEHAAKIFNALPLTEQKRAAYLTSAQQHADALNWQSAAKKYTLT